MRRFNEKYFAVCAEIAKMNAEFERRSKLFDSIVEVLAGLKSEDLELVLRIVKALERGN